MQSWSILIGTLGVLLGCNTHQGGRMNRGDRVDDKATDVRVAVIGVPNNSLGTPDGVARGPAALRRAGLLETLAAHADTLDYGDVRFAPPSTERDPGSGVLGLRSLVTMVQAVNAGVARALSEGRFPIVIGGDCPLVLGCLAAARKVHGRVGLVFVDGHEDAWPPQQAPTGQAADLELGFALGRHLGGLPKELAQLLPLVQSSDVAILGARNAGELAEFGIASLRGEVEFYDDKELRNGGIHDVTMRVVARLRDSAGVWWLHSDVDVLSQEVLPTDFPQAGGLSWEEFGALTRAGVNGRGAVGWDITVYNPDQDPDGRLARRLVSSIGAAIAGRTPS
jgi:arginase